ncbi:MAG: hypothetical protein H3C62_05830 [Gemmatimonadaceae bacterium]|nr:hypothetical protein [Gemmatimonadaceae bacterium]
MPEYVLYGLTLRADRAVPGLDPVDESPRADLTITLGATPPPRDVWDAARPHFQEPGATVGVPSVDVRRTANDAFWFRYEDGTEFLLDAAATRIDAWWTATSTLEDTATYLLGPVLGFALRMRGVLALHASAVVIDGRAVALVGPSGAGKSTTAAAFASAGVPVLSDDVLALRQIDGRWMAYPAYPTVRLWDESEHLLFGSVGTLPLLTPTWDKRGLPLGAAYPFHATPMPLGELFLLAPRSDDARAPWVEPLGGSAAFIALVANTYANYLLDDPLRAAEMRALEGVLAGRRVRRLVPSTLSERLSRLVTIVADALSAPGS